MFFAPCKYVDDQTYLEHRIDICQLPYEIYRIRKRKKSVKNSDETYFVSNYNSLVGCELITNGTSKLLIADKIIVSPNLFASWTSIQFSAQVLNADLTIYNSFGQKVMQLKGISGREFAIYRNGLPTGIYFLRLMQVNKVIASVKLIIIEQHYIKFCE